MITWAYIFQQSTSEGLFFSFGIHSVKFVGFLIVLLWNIYLIWQFVILLLQKDKGTQIYQTGTGISAFGHLTVNQLWKECIFRSRTNSLVAQMNASDNKVFDRFNLPEFREPMGRLQPNWMFSLLKTGQDFYSDISLFLFFHQLFIELLNALS